MTRASTVAHRGGCHCGAVAFEVDAPADILALDCNCSICRMTGFLHLIVPQSRFRLLRGEQDLVEYRFNTGIARHLFCRRCGVKSFYVPRSNPDGYSVNVRCLDRVTVASIRVEPFDDNDRAASDAKVREMSKDVVVVDYDSSWPLTFQALAAPIWEAVRGIASGVEHVGSTAVPGLAAKAIIDIDIIVPSRADMPAIVERLAMAGYVHCGNLGIEGREAFQGPGGLPKHHLYACIRGGAALANHLAVRDYLRGNRAAAAAYADLKRKLAAEFPTDIESYVAGKTEFLRKLLLAAGVPAAP